MIESSPRKSYNKVFSLLKEHHKWFENSIPLIASENIPSPAVREAIISVFGKSKGDQALLTDYAEQ